MSFTNDVLKFVKLIDSKETQYLNIEPAYSTNDESK